MCQHQIRKARSLQKYFPRSVLNNLGESNRARKSPLCSATFFCASFFPFFTLSTPRFPWQFSSPKSPLSGNSNLLFLVETRQPARDGFGGGFWTGSPTPEKKENPLFWLARKGEFRKTQRGIKMDGFQMASFLNFNLKLGIFGTRLFWYPFGCLSSSARRSIKTDGFQNGKASEDAPLI